MSDRAEMTDLDTQKTHIPEGLPAEFHAFWKYLQEAKKGQFIGEALDWSKAALEALAAETNSRQAHETALERMAKAYKSASDDRDSCKQMIEDLRKELKQREESLTAAYQKIEDLERIMARL